MHAMTHALNRVMSRDFSRGLRTSLALCFALVAGCRGVSSSSSDAGLMKLAVVFDDSMGQASLGMEAKRGAMMAIEEARSSDFRAVYCGDAGAADAAREVGHTSLISSGARQALLMVTPARPGRNGGHRPVGLPLGQLAGRWVCRLVGRSAGRIVGRVGRPAGRSATKMPTIRRPAIKPAVARSAPSRLALAGMTGRSEYSAIDIKTEGTNTGTTSGFRVC
jgi:hypothetical protein